MVGWVERMLDEVVNRVLRGGVGVMGFEVNRVLWRGVSE